MVTGLGEGDCKAYGYPQQDILPSLRQVGNRRYCDSSIFLFIVSHMSVTVFRDVLRKDDKKNMKRKNKSSKKKVLNH